MALDRIVLAAAAACLAGCSGLRPWKLERLQYGMEHCHVAELLEEPSLPAMRFFARDEHGREQDVRIEVAPGADGHANYALVSTDGRLASVSIAAASPPYFGRAWWRDAHHWDWRELRCPYWPEELEGLVRSAAERRLELAWDRLEPIDAAFRTSGRYTALGMGTILVLPLVLYTPYYVATALFDGRYDRAVDVRSFLLTLPRDATIEQVVAELGPPAADASFARGDGSQRVLAYELAGGFRITIGYLDGRLLWVDFGQWHDWSWSFADLAFR
jgi:hypothetical protein